MKKLPAFVLSFVSAFFLGGCSKKAASIGIIGGADGPTAIFVTSKINWPYVCGLIFVPVAVILIALIYRNQKKK